jgi:preprotein translocase subunit SecY
MPIIFASSIVSIPATIAAFVNEESGFAKFVNDWLGATSPVYIIVFIALIVAFSYFYIAISFNPVEVANNIRNNGGAIIGIRPQEMAPFIKKILNRVTLMGAIFLVVIAATPLIVSAIVSLIPGASFTSLAFTGTSLLIVVGVALETVRDLEAQLSMRNYKGFLD